MNEMDIYTKVISILAFILSAYVAYSEYKRREPNLAFFHRFKKNTKEYLLEIVVTNTSSNSIDLIEAGYFLGNAKAFRRIPSKSSITLESHKSSSFHVSWSRETELTLQVEEFQFKTSTGKVFTHRLGRSIKDEFELHLFLDQTPNEMLQMEKLQYTFDEELKKVDDSRKEVERLLSQVETSDPQGQ